MSHNNGFWKFMNDNFIFILLFGSMAIVPVLIGISEIVHGPQNHKNEEPEKIEQVESPRPTRMEELTKLVEQYNSLPEHDPLRRVLRDRIDVLSAEIVKSE